MRRAYLWLVLLAMALQLWACGSDPQKCSDQIPCPDGEFCQNGTCAAVAEVVHDGETLTAEVKWSGRHLIKGILHVTFALEIEACTVVRMSPDASIRVEAGGSLKTVGTAECPVKFTSTTADAAAGAWDAIRFYRASAATNSLSYTILEYGGKGGYGVVWVEGGNPDGASLAIDNTTFRDISAVGLLLNEGSKIGSFTGNTFQRIGAELIEVRPKDVAELDDLTSLENTAKNYVALKGGNTAGSAAWLWKNLGVPYALDETNGLLIISENTVEVEAGTTLLMGPNSQIRVENVGALKLSGTGATPEAAVQILSVKNPPSAGDWTRIQVYKTSTNANNIFNYAVIKHGGGGNNGQLKVESGATVALNNTAFSDGATCDVFLATGTPNGAVTNANSTYTTCTP